MRVATHTRLFKLHPGRQLLNGAEYALWYLTLQYGIVLVGQ